MKKIISVFSILCLTASFFLSPITVFAAAPAYEIAGKTVSSGETFTIDVNIKDNPGIISLRLSVTYGDELTLLSVTNKNLLNGWTTPAAAISSPYTLRWADSLATENNKANGNIVTLTFKAKDTATALSSNILISHIEARNADGTKVEFANMSATVKINPTPAVLTSISVKNTPNKTNYFVGDLLDVTGLKLTATYNNGTAETITEGYTCSPMNLDKAGTQKITATYQGKTATFNVTVKEKATQELELNPNSVFEVDNSANALTGVSAGATAADILSTFSGGDIEIIKNGKKLGANALVGTGCVIELKNGNEVIDTLTIVVKGDLDGDGAVNVSDARKALRAAVELETINEFQTLAADVDGKAGLGVTDARIILRVAVELQSF